MQWTKKNEKDKEISIKVEEKMRNLFQSVGYRSQNFITEVYAHFGLHSYQKKFLSSLNLKVHELSHFDVQVAFFIAIND